MAEGSLEIFELLELIPSMLMNKDNNMLEACPSFEEVYQTIKNMDGESATDVEAWEVIGNDVYKEILSLCGVTPKHHAYFGHSVA